MVSEYNEPASAVMCHLCGMLSAFIGFVSVIGGVVLMAGWPDTEVGDYSLKAIGLFLIVCGSVFMVFFVTYVCVIAKQSWRFFGCCRLHKPPDEGGLRFKHDTSPTNSIQSSVNSPPSIGTYSNKASIEM